MHRFHAKVAIDSIDKAMGVLLEYLLSVHEGIDSILLINCPILISETADRIWCERTVIMSMDQEQLFDWDIFQNDLTRYVQLSWKAKTLKRHIRK